MTGLAGQLQNGAETASMLPSASWGTGEPLLLASVILTTFLCCLPQLRALLTCMNGLAGQMQNGAYGNTGEALLLASMLLTTLVCLSCRHG